MGRGCHVTLCKYRICQSPYQRWIPKPLQHSLPFPCRKLGSIHNVWLSENSFNTQSLNITPPLKTLLNPSPSTPSVCVFSITEDQKCNACFLSNYFNICNRRRRAVTDGFLDWSRSVGQICCCLLAGK